MPLEKEKIIKVVNELQKKYKTYNAAEIAKDLDIIVLYEDLGTIHGYYNKAYRQKFIHINNNLSRGHELMTLAHELGHAILHPNQNTLFLKKYTRLSVSKLEMEANYFAFLIMNDFYSEKQVSVINDKYDSMILSYEECMKIINEYYQMGEIQDLLNQTIQIIDRKIGEYYESKNQEKY